MCHVERNTVKFGDKDPRNEQPFLIFLILYKTSCSDVKINFAFKISFFDNVLLCLASWWSFVSLGVAEQIIWIFLYITHENC